MIRQMQMAEHNDEFAEEQMMLQKAIEESKKETTNADAMTYEELLALSDQLGHVSKGFSSAEIELIPISKIKDLYD